MPSLSIIIPVYNVEKYLVKCLDSVLVDNQFKGQVICVNDGSTDSSLSILEEYAVKYPNIEVYSQSNAGLSVARNTGFDKATGDYVFFVDSDDWIFPETILKVLARINNEDVIYFNAKKYYEATNIWDKDCPLQELHNINGQSYFAITMKQKANLPFVCVVGGFYSRAFLLRNSLYNEPGIYHEDSYFTPQVLLKAKDVSRINVTLYAYRIRTSGSITTSVRDKHIKDRLFIIRNLYTLYMTNTHIDMAFYDDLSNQYIVVLLEAYSNKIDIGKYWEFNDSIVFKRCSRNDSRNMKIAKLTFLSRRIAYKYCQDTLPILLRKCINRFL